MPLSMNEEANGDKEKDKEVQQTETEGEQTEGTANKEADGTANQVSENATAEIHADKDSPAKARNTVTETDLKSPIQNITQDPDSA